MLDHEESRKFEKAFEVPADYREQRDELYARSVASYHRDSEALRVPWDQVKDKPSMVDEIKKMETITRLFDGNFGLAEGL